MNIISSSKVFHIYSIKVPRIRTWKYNSGTFFQSTVAVYRAKVVFITKRKKLPGWSHDTKCSYPNSLFPEKCLHNFRDVAKQAFGFLWSWIHFQNFIWFISLTLLLLFLLLFIISLSLDKTVIWNQYSYSVYYMPGTMLNEIIL